MTETKQKLAEYAAMKNKISRLSTQIEELEEMSKSIKTATDFSRIRVRSSAKKEAAFEETVAKIDELIRKRTEYMSTLIDMTEDIEKIIRQLKKNPVLEDVLWYRYVKAMHIKDIAEEMHYSEQYIYELLQKALQKLEEIETSE